MRRRLFVLFIAVAAVSSVLQPRPVAAAPHLHVVATVGDLGAIAREVLGDAGDVVVLARPTQDPHFVDARPNLILDLNRADVLLSMGLDYEVGWLPVLVRGSRNPRIQVGAPGNFVASSVVPLLEVPHGHVDRSMGDIHPGGNPHFTLDPRNAVRIARGVAGVFGDLAPENRAIYDRNAAAFVAQLEAREKAWQASAAPYKGTPVVTYHKSFAYFVSWLGLTEAGNIEPKPGIPPNAAHVAELVGAMRAQHVPIILQERWYPSNVAERLASQTGAHLVLISGMTPDGGHYADHIDEVVRAVVGALATAHAGAKP
jgi:zinc/manganese transport system substrate-binding protein